MTQQEIINLLPEFLRNSSTYSLIITDLEGKYIYVNDVFEQRFSFLSPHFVGEHISVAIHPEDLAKCDEVVQKCFIHPDKSFPIEIRKPSNLKNEYHWTHWEFSLFKDKAGTPVGILCLGHDITASKAKENQIVQQNERLKQITWQQSHEVRRHMVNMMGLYKLIKDSAVLTETEKIEKLDLLLNETKELDQIIHAIVERSVGKE
ncbi:PAS domain-containing protein [Sediminibacterium sp.]|uniref:PAS domain-containing protein n=1 Tax=Sediminibacterium sp. TaxID=1917865 RepID=UPI002734BF61|nr:PAS domain-containing protein [Sediminibacterium sp.]MDP3394257.1 PAS domain-containing protein [Sediminibacterium sp.]MDP3567053.1 PAS domain-containing protein [Sediminibacterium sp.]